MFTRGEIFGNGLTCLTSVCAYVSVQEITVLYIPLIVGAVTCIGVVVRTFHLARESKAKAREANDRAYKESLVAQREYIALCELCKKSGIIPKTCIVRNGHIPDNCTMSKISKHEP